MPIIGSTSEAPKWLFIALLVCAALGAPALVSARATFTHLVVFGDSLSDPGNAFALRGGTNTPPDYSVSPFLIPDRPYARGGHHFSNGATWAEQFARAQGLAANGLPAFRGENPRATNYAIGGARARLDGSESDLTHQVSEFLEDFGGAAPAEALYVIAIGGNDIREVAATQDPSLVFGALDAIQANIVRLYLAGARQFLVWNAPKVAVTPAIRIADALLPGTAAAIDDVTVQYNGFLEAYLGALEQSLPGIRIVRFDFYGLVEAIHDDGDAYGLLDVDSACITPNVPPFRCRNPDSYAFWDGIHPTRAVHAIIAHEVAQALAQ